MSDNTVALGIRPLDPNALPNALQAASDYNLRQAQAKLSSAQIGETAQRTNQLAIANDFQQQLNAARLQSYYGAGTGGNGSPSVPDGGGNAPPNQLQAANGSPSGGGVLSPGFIQRYSLLDPASGEKMSSTLKNLNETEQSHVNFRWDQIGRAMLASTDPTSWNQNLIRLRAQNAITPDEYVQYANNYSPQLRNQLLGLSQSVKDTLTTSGVVAGNEAAAKQPYELQKVAAEGAQARQTGASNAAVGASYDLVPVRDPATGQTNMVPKTALIGTVGLGGVPAAGPAAGAAPPPMPQGAGGAPVVPGSIAQPMPVAPGSTNPAAVPPRPIIGIPTKPELTPEQEGASKKLGDLNAEIIDNEAKAPKTLQDVQILRSAAQDAFRPGASGEARAALGKSVLDAYQLAGLQPPDWAQKQALGSDVISKVGGQMATEIVRSLGTKEALGIYQAVQRYMPNVSMSNGGFDAVLNSIQQGAVRNQDMADFRRTWLSDPAHNGSIDGMVASFDKTHPPEVYASHVWPMMMPKSADAAVPGAIYKNANGVNAMWNGHGFVPVGSP